MHHQQSSSSSNRKRPRPCRTSTLRTTSLLCLLVALLAIQQQSSVKAFVVATSTHDPHYHPTTTKTQAPSNAPSQAPTTEPSALSSSASSSAVLDYPVTHHDHPHTPPAPLPNNHNDDHNHRLPDGVDEWAARYTSLEALRQQFGGNHHKVWGDLQASTARKLYKILLPRALLELSRLEHLHPQDLAPLAYQARRAAKMYARERCTVPARIGATLFDGFRQWIKYGRFQGNGMTYDQLWEKYADKILAEMEQHQHHHHPSEDETAVAVHDDDEKEEEEWMDDELSEQVSLKILERACASNESVDKMVLESRSAQRPLTPAQQRLLESIRTKLEQDMYQLLLPSSDHKVLSDTESDMTDSEDDRSSRGAERRHGQDQRTRRRFWTLSRNGNDVPPTNVLVPRNKRQRRDSAFPPQDFEDTDGDAAFRNRARFWQERGPYAAMDNTVDSSLHP